MAIDAVVGDICLSAHEPLRKGNVGPVEHLLPRCKPVHTFRLLTPKSFRIFGRSFVQRFIFGHGAYGCALGEFCRRWEELLLRHAAGLRRRLYRTAVIAAYLWRSARESSAGSLIGGWQDVPEQIMATLFFALTAGSSGMVL